MVRLNKSEANRTPAYDFEDQYTTIILRSFLCVPYVRIAHSCNTGAQLMLPVPCLGRTIK